MKLTQIICICLLLAAVTAVTLKVKSSAQAKAIEILRNKKHSWSKLVLNLAELHMMSDGTLDDLVEVLKDLLSDLSQKQDKFQNNYNQDQIAHNLVVARINSDLASANSDIASLTSLLDQVLIPKLQDLQTTIESQEQDIIASHTYISKITTEREESHKIWNERVIDHNEAIVAIVEAEKILNQLLYSDVAVSLLQINSSKSSLVKIEKKLGKKIDTTLARALVELATSDEANNDTIKKVLSMLDQIKDNLTSSLNNENINEEQEENDFIINVQITQDHLKKITDSDSSNKNDLENTQSSITQNDSFLSSRKVDLDKHTQDLDDESAHFDKITERFKDLMGQIDSEISSCQSALNVIENGDFANYIVDRLNNAAGSDLAHLN